MKQANPRTVGRLAKRCGVAAEHMRTYITGQRRCAPWIVDRNGAWDRWQCNTEQGAK